MQTLNRSPQTQQGAVLIIALVMLLILTILGIAVMESSVQEERMAGNFMDRNHAFQAAEFALRDAEQEIQSWVEAPVAGEPPVNSGNAPVYSFPSAALGSTHSKWWEQRDFNWWQQDTNTFSVDTGNFFRINQPPRYVIEEHSAVCDTLTDPRDADCIMVYRITAIAQSGRNTTVTLQTLFSRRF